MERNIFIACIREGALKGQKDYNILPSLTIAQAILESGWGTSRLTKLANNLFGIKAFSDWKGRRITLPSSEWVLGKMVEVNEDFRAYDSFSESIEDHSRLLSGFRYKPVRECSGYREACKLVYKCGYATDPGYPGKLVRIIEENRLYDYDGANILANGTSGIDGEKIRNFQKLCNSLGIKDSEGKILAEDNILGWRTESCIGKMPVLMMGSHGQAVAYVQSLVGAFPVDGDFGPITKECVMRFQRSKAISADGIVGKETWRNLLKSN